MIYSLILGRKGSKGFPGKNLYMLDGKPISWYAMDAAIRCPDIDRHFISTDDPELKILGEKMGFEVIERPDFLATDKATGQDAYKHGYEVIVSRTGQHAELLVLLFCNAPTISPTLLSEGILALKNNPEADSAVTVSRFNMYSPVRARRVDDEGYLQPFIPFEHFPDKDIINCNRDSQGSVWFADVAMSVIRPSNLERLEEGLLPQKWMGKKILPIFNDVGLDVDYEWQIGQAEWWIRNKRS